MTLFKYDMVSSCIISRVLLYSLHSCGRDVYPWLKKALDHNTIHSQRMISRLCTTKASQSALTLRQKIVKQHILSEYKGTLWIHWRFMVGVVIPGMKRASTPPPPPLPPQNPYALDWHVPWDGMWAETHLVLLHRMAKMEKPKRPFIRSGCGAVNSLP